LNYAVNSYLNLPGNANKNTLIDAIAIEETYGSATSVRQFGVGSITYAYTPVPEPATILLLGLGLLGLTGVRRKIKS
jgi:hypothetical protein